MSTEEKFEELYDKIVNENLFEMERLRQEAKRAQNKVIIKLIILTIISSIVILYTVYIESKMGTDYRASILVAGLCVGGYVAIGLNRSNKKTEIYKMSFKDKIIKTIIKMFDENLEYNPKSGVPFSVFKEAEFEESDIYSAEDGIEGILKNGCKFIMSEVLTQNESSDSEGNTSRYLVFNGLFVKIQFPGYLNSAIYLRKDRNIIKRVARKQIAF